MLHVPDQGGLPVEEVQRSVGRDLEVDRPEIRVAALHEGFEFVGAEARALVGERVTEDALEADDVRDQVVVPERLGEVGTREDLGGRGGAAALAEEGEVAPVLVGFGQPAGER